MARVSPCEQSSHELWLEAPTSNTAKRTGFYLFFLLVGGGGFEPPKSETSDLQSALQPSNIHNLLIFNKISV